MVWVALTGVAAPAVSAQNTPIGLYAAADASRNATEQLAHPPGRGAPVGPALRCRRAANPSSNACNELVGRSQYDVTVSMDGR